MTAAAVLVLVLLLLLLAPLANALGAAGGVLVVAEAATGGVGLTATSAVLCTTGDAT